MEYSQLPEWNAQGVEPPQTKKNSGWQSGERPPAPWFNWLFHRIYQSFIEIRNAFNSHEEAAQGVHGLAPTESVESTAGAQAKADAAQSAAQAYAAEVASAAEAAAKSYADNAVAAHANRTDNPHQVTPQQIGAETPNGAQQKIQDHAAKTTGVHGVGSGFYVAKTPRADQLIAWDDVQDKPVNFSPSPHTHDERYYTKSQIDQLLVPVTTWYAPSDTPIISALNERKAGPLLDIPLDIWVPVLAFSVPHPGRYRVTGEYRGTDATLYDRSANPYDVGLRAGVRISVAPGVPVSTPIMSQKGRSAWGDTGWVTFWLDMEVPTRTGLVVLEGLCSYDIYESYPDAEPGGVSLERRYGATWVRQIVLRGSQSDPNPDQDQTFEVIRFI